MRKIKIVTAARKDKHGDITHLCGYYEKGSRILSFMRGIYEMFSAKQDKKAEHSWAESQEEIIFNIENNVCDYLVLALPEGTSQGLLSRLYLNKRIKVIVIDDKRRGKYLRAGFDTNTENNLDSLPRC